MLKKDIFLIVDITLGSKYLYKNNRKQGPPWLTEIEVAIMVFE